MTRSTVASLFLALGLVVGPGPEALAKGFDVEAAQALLDVQSLDGWLLYQNGDQNPVAQALVAPGRATRAWFYWVPANGSPIALVAKAELGAFAEVAGEKVSYTSATQWKAKLKVILGDAKTVAMEYAPDSGIAGLTRVDARTAAIVTELGMKIVSSAQLVQFTKSAWGVGGRVSHYVATHHLTVLVGEATAFIGEKLAAGEVITEYDVQQHILAGYQVRGLAGEPPLVATGVSTADPSYRPSAQSARVIKAGDLIQFELSAHVATDARPIVANISWVAYVGDTVPARLVKAFATVAKARGAAIDLIRQRIKLKRTVAGFEADRAAREVIEAAGMGERFTHRTGHSLDTAVAGDGANLDSLEANDTRNLVVGSGFTIGPGVYFSEDFGLRSEVSVFLSATGLELTSEPQSAIFAIRVRRP